MFLFLAPKKTAVVKKSQQKRDNEKREAEAREAAKADQEQKAVANGLFANAKGGDNLLKKLQDSTPEGGDE